MAVIDSMLTMLSSLLASPHAVAIFLGLIISWFGTQWMKFRLPLPPVWSARRRWMVRLASLPLGFVPTFLMWPGATHERAMWALGVAFAAPTVYRLVTAVLYRFWPDLETRLSADPYRDEDAAG